ncbi:hypothetical protein D910_05714, partial [Dendroctonus ponderosae]
MWLNHAGQTTAESALEYIITAHPATPEMTKQIGHMSVYTYLNKILKIKAQKKKLSATSFLTKDIHVIPDFDGNKSPLSDPSIRGMISGLSLTTSLESLAYLYLATIQSLAYSTRHIMSGLAQQGHEIKCILIGGDLGQNSLFANLQKDVCQMPIVSPQEPRSKLIGAAILDSVLRWQVITQTAMSENNTTIAQFRKEAKDASKYFLKLFLSFLYHDFRIKGFVFSKACKCIYVLEAAKLSACKPANLNMPIFRKSVDHIFYKFFISIFQYCGFPAAVASKTFPDFRHASREMCGMGQVVLPTTNADEISYHERKYQVFLKMYDHQLQYRKIMS